MSTSVPSPRSPVASAGWVVALLVGGLLALILVPRRVEEPVPPPAVPPPPTELEKVGLPNNVDLEGLPGFFAVWADQGSWQDDRAWFAYRHPVSGEFSYRFEATRTGGGYRFREAEPSFAWELGPVLAEDSPIRFLQPERSPTSSDPGPRPGLEPSRARELPATVPVKLESESAKVPPPRPIPPPDPKK
jgi:hypothetical protein